MNKAFEIALSHYGIYEIPGKENNPEVVQFFHDIGHDWVDNDETAWCSAFAGSCCKKAGLEYSNKLNAVSWLNVGYSIKYPVEKPQIGDIVVFWRISPDSGYGHVGFFIRETENYIYVLGGNQSNQVNISRYPSKQFLGFRRLNQLA